MGDHRGYTLIEMLIVIAMIAVLGSSTLLTISIYDNANVRKMSKELNNQLEKARMTAMSKTGKVGLQLSLDGDGALKIDSYNFDTGAATNAAILGKDLEVTYKQTSASAAIDLSSSPVNIRFDKTLGSVLDGEGLFVIQKKERKAGVILYKLTGKHDVVGGDFNGPY